MKEASPRYPVNPRMHIIPRLKKSSRARAVNFLFCWVAAFILSFSFRHFVNYAYPNYCLSTELWQFDELVRPVIVYAALLFLYSAAKVLRIRYDNVKYSKDYLPKAIVIAASVMFEVLQNTFPLINAAINAFHIYPQSCFFGSVEDLMMDFAVVFFFMSDPKEEIKRD
jgi:hypothetical protein